MGSSAQTNSGVHWCRRRVRFNEVPEKVPKVPKKVWEGARSRSTGFRKRFPRRFQRRCGRLWCKARSGSAGFQKNHGNPAEVFPATSQHASERLVKKYDVAVGWAHILDLTRCACRCTRLESILFRRFVVSSFQSYAAGTAGRWRRRSAAWAPPAPRGLCPRPRRPNWKKNNLKNSN